MPTATMTASALAEFGARLSRYRDAAGLTQEQLGEQIGSGPTTIGKWERGENDPSASSIAKICRVLRVSADALLGLGETPDFARRTETIYTVDVPAIHRALAATTLAEFERVGPIAAEILPHETIVTREQWEAYVEQAREHGARLGGTAKRLGDAIRRLFSTRR